MNLINILEQSALKYPNKPALTMKIGFRNKTLSYAQVYELSKKIALFLENEGINKGDKVIICAPNSPYWICVFWATLLRGAIIVPLNIQSTKSAIDKIIAQTEAKIIFKHVFFKFELEQKIKQFDIDFINDLVENINLKDFKKVDIDENDLFQIMYTSGTTGDPKGVMLTHKNVYSNVITISNIIIVDLQKDRLLSILPLSHIFEQTVGFLLPYYRGVHIIYTHSYAAVRQLMKVNKITKMIAVPEFLQLILSKIELEIETKGKKNLYNKMLQLAQKLNNKFISRILFYKIINGLGGKINTFASGGAPLDPNLEIKWESIGIDILQGYGLTETSPVIATNTYQEKKLGSVGKVIPNVQVKINEDSELLVKGPNVFKGYYKNDQKTQETFTLDGWFKTGDLGKFDKENFLFIKGRKKYLIKSSGGQNVYPEDIEAELNKINGVIESCVLGIEKDTGAVEIHAVILPDLKIKIEPEQIIHQANEHLATYQQITAWSIWPDVDFPRTVTRKVKKEEVRKFLESKQKELQTVSKEKKSRLIQILSQLTGIETSQINETSKLTTDLNLDSLMRVELVAWIEEDMNIIIQETDIKHGTTVKDLEELIKIKKPTSESAKLKKWPRSIWIIPFRFIAQQLLFLLLKFYVPKLKIEGKENLENLKFPVIFMPTHTSILDSLILTKALPLKIRNRTTFAAARDTLYDQYKIGSIILEGIFNAFPIQRGEAENIKLGLDFIGQILDQNYSVVIYPEGQMSKSGELLPLKRGVGIIATEMDAQIIPVKIVGTRNIIPYESIYPKGRSDITIKFGKPMKFKRSDSQALVIENIAKAIKEL